MRLYGRSIILETPARRRGHLYWISLPLLGCVEVYKWGCSISLGPTCWFIVIDLCRYPRIEVIRT